jgi:hypothetical protein
MSEDSFTWGESSGNGENSTCEDASDLTIDYFGAGRNLADSRR